MSGIILPRWLPEFRALESTPSRAATFATNVRAVGVGVKDVQDWAEGNAAPEWEGDTAAAHDHATTRFARRLDGVEAALQRAVTAADRFEARLTVLASRRAALEAERIAVNTDTDTLRTEVLARGDLATEAEVEGFRRRAEALARRAERVTSRIDRWILHYDTAESDFIASLATVDEVSEGQAAAVDPGRVDPATLLDEFRRHAADPVALNGWWRGLSRAERQAVITEDPHRVGNAAGIPAGDRDAANRAALHSDLDYWAQREADGQLTREERSARDNAAHVRAAIDRFRPEIDVTTGHELLQVLVYRPAAHSGDGAVAIGFGDPDTADHVSVDIPGLTSETSSTVGNLERTLALYLAADGERNGSVAAIHWLDYDAPSGNPLKPWETLDFGGVVTTGQAAGGGERFADFIDGLRASDDGDRAHVTAIGHSYGSTALGHGLQDGAVVDDAILIGSPGQPAASASGLTAADVWVGSKDNDPVTLLGDGERGGVGALGHDPADDDFGGTRFATGDGSLRVEDLIGNHSSYFRDTSLDNMARIVADRDDQVTTQPHRGDPGGDHLTLSELLVVASGASAGEWVTDRAEDAVDLGEGVVDWLVDRSPGAGVVGWVS